MEIQDLDIGDIRIKLIAHNSGKSYIASLNGREFLEEYSRLEDYTEKSLIKKIKSMPQKPRWFTEIKESVICAPVNDHFELEIILSGTAVFQDK